MKYIKLISLLGLFSILITSCSKKSKLGKLIPKEAAVVVEINSKSLLSKLSWDEIKQTYWYNYLMTDTTVPASAKTFLGDPSKTGINMDESIISFVVMGNNNGNNVVQGSLKDGKLFGDFLKNMHPEGTISKDGDMDIFKTPDAVVGWKNERFVFVTNSDNKMPDMSMMDDSTNVTVPLPKPSADSLLAACKNIFSLSEENSLYKNERFAELEEEDGDMHVWLNINELSKSSMSNMPGMMGMVKLDKFLVDNISTITINFEDGRIAGIMKQYFGKELSDILKKGDGNLDADMVKRISSPNLAGVYALHFSPANMLEIIKLTGLDGFINIAMAQAGISLDDVVKAIKGDMVFAVSDVTINPDTTKLNGLKDTIGKSQKPEMTFLFAVAIGDKDAFNKLVKMGNGLQKDMAGKNTFQKSDDKYFALSNSQDAVNKYFSGTQTSPNFLSTISGHPIGAYVDLQMILKAFQSEFTKDSIGKTHYDRNIALWNNIYFTGGEFKDGGIVTKGEINFVDKSTNSLKQLNKYIDENAKVIIEKKKKQREEWSTDSTYLKPVSDSVPVNKTKKRSKSRK